MALNISYVASASCFQPFKLAVCNIEKLCIEIRLLIKLYLLYVCIALNRYASTADINDLPDGCPSLSSSEESIGGAAAMRQEQDIFDVDYEFLESHRSSVSCSDLLLHCAETPTKVAR